VARALRLVADAIDQRATVWVSEGNGLEHDADNPERFRVDLKRAVRDAQLFAAAKD